VRDDQVGIVGTDGHLESVLDEMRVGRRERDIVSVKELERHNGIRNREQGYGGQVVRPGWDSYSLTTRGIYVVGPTDPGEGLRVEGTFNPRHLLVGFGGLTYPVAPELSAYRLGGATT
jgi:hypothetical protein